MSLDQLSVIIPTLNEADHIKKTLSPLQIFRDQGLEIILVDGGSTDGTCGMVVPWVDRVASQSGGRGAQLGLGAALASGVWLLFLHADTRISSDALQHLLEAIQNQPHLSWGRFHIMLSGQGLIFRVIEFLINLRSSVTRICTGDQGMFVKRQVFESVGGFPEWPILEDVELSQRLRKVSAPVMIKTSIVTSSRRWETRGVVKTILIMWLIRLGFWIGMSPVRLHRWYRAHGSG